jgi:ElaB/YqjD/DUF883 family membrane-anchored ribosome-binding protein
MSQHSIFKPIGVATILIAIGGFPAAQRSDTEGIKETENFVKAGEKTSRAIGDAKTQLQNTLGAYNSLVTQPSKDMKGDYKKLLKAVKEMNEKLSDARENVTNMETVGTTYFAGRAAAIKNIQDADLRDKAQKRLDENQTAYEGVLTSFQRGHQALEPLRKDLADQIIYLGSDLTPGATASLKPQAEKLNQRGSEVFAKTDQAVEAANSYFNSMRPTKS